MDNSRHSKSKRKGQSGKLEFSSRKLHKDWRVWLVVGLMVAAMVIYVLTLDDSIVPITIRS
ncbi:MAG: hypothetical protein NTY51_04875 [Deltaproteobacteria bacterium]|nr:hypothetical protein [Deltaproteobacteria bacterium]